MAHKDTNELMFNRAKEITVGQIVGNFPGVADPQVMIDPTQHELSIEGNVESLGHRDHPA